MDGTLVKLMESGGRHCSRIMIHWCFRFRHAKLSIILAEKLALFWISCSARYAPDACAIVRILITYSSVTVTRSHCIWLRVYWLTWRRSRKCTKGVAGDSFSNSTVSFACYFTFSHNTCIANKSDPTMIPESPSLHVLPALFSEGDRGAKPSFLQWNENSLSLCLFNGASGQAEKEGSAHQVKFLYPFRSSTHSTNDSKSSRPWWRMQCCFTYSSPL